MKEFKSAHSKMFSRRRNNERLDGENELQQQVDLSESQPAPKRTAPTTNAIKTINTKKLTNVLAPSQLHLAAAN